jgi:hypothetical protein
VYQVDCDVNPSDPSCAGNGTGIDPASQRMANLYSDDMVSGEMNQICKATNTDSQVPAL